MKPDQANAPKGSPRMIAIVVVVVVVLVAAGAGAFLLLQKPTAVSTSSTCTPVAAFTQTISLSNASSPTYIPSGRDLVFPLPVPLSRLNPQVVDNFSLSAGGPVQINIYSSTEYFTFQAAFNASSSSGGEDVPTLYSSGPVSTGSFTFDLPGANATYYLTYINRATTNMTIASNANLVWALPSC